MAVRLGHNCSILAAVWGSSHRAGFVIRFWFLLKPLLGCITFGANWVAFWYGYNWPLGMFWGLFGVALLQTKVNHCL